MIDQKEILDAKILIVDDRQSNVILLEQLLKKDGYRYVMSTMNPFEVCALHVEHHFDLILLDLQMPQMDGFQVMEGIGLIEDMGYSPILAITAQPAHKLRALKAGAKDFISKPLDAVEFQTRVRNLLEVRLLYKRLEFINEELEQKVIERTAQLAASEARFKNFTELISDWYWEQDEQGRFTTVSGPVFEMLGIAAGPGNDEVPVDLNEAEMAALKHNIANRQPFIDFVYRLKKADGTTRLLRVSGTPVFDGNCRFVGYRGVGVVVAEDLYAQPSDALFREGIDTIDTVMCLADADSMRILDASAALSRMTGITRDDLLTRRFDELPLTGLEVLPALLRRLLNNGGKQHMHTRLTRTDGTSIALLAEFYVCRDDKRSVLIGVLSQFPEPDQA